MRLTAQAVAYCLCRGASTKTWELFQQVDIITVNSVTAACATSTPYFCATCFRCLRLSPALLDAWIDCGWVDMRWKQAVAPPNPGPLASGALESSANRLGRGCHACLQQRLKAHAKRVQLKRACGYGRSQRVGGQHDGTLTPPQQWGS